MADVTGEEIVTLPVDTAVTRVPVGTPGETTCIPTTTPVVVNDSVLAPADNEEKLCTTVVIGCWKTTLAEAATVAAVDMVTVVTRVVKSTETPVTVVPPSTPAAVINMPAETPVEVEENVTVNELDVAVKTVNAIGEIGCRNTTFDVIATVNGDEIVTRFPETTVTVVPADTPMALTSMPTVIPVVEEKVMEEAAEAAVVGVNITGVAAWLTVQLMVAPGPAVLSKKAKVLG